jgi:hypothetical protein
VEKLNIFLNFCFLVACTVEVRFARLQIEFLDRVQASFMCSVTKIKRRSAKILGQVIHASFSIVFLNVPICPTYFEKKNQKTNRFEYRFESQKNKNKYFAPRPHIDAPLHLRGASWHSENCCSACRRCQGLKTWSFENGFKR